ncbi:LuxR family transcriptional regulator [Verrucomicrobia bacterium IMCC26134]|jgi:DNA-binding NarL/FixJ family response regulator|nr:LuxR family transcriptional regulator [Verrucomicrobia bacterium IMCC26134]
MKRFIIVEDQTVVREMLAELLSSAEGFQCVGTCGDGHEAIELCASTKPDVAVLDINLPGLHGVDLLKRLKRTQPDLRVLIFSGYESPALIREVIAAGALGFVEKTAGYLEFKKGLDAVGNGQTYYGPAVTALLKSVVENPETSKTPDFITDREREILKLVAESHSTKEIALKLKISPKTVDNHRTNMMRKLHLHDVASLTRHAIDIGLVIRRSER